MSNIEWTQQTWNPIAGCSKVSAGCANCYAEVMAGRLARMGQAKYQELTVLQGKHARWTGKIAFDEDALLAPLRRKKPTTYFVNSMSDLFHENVTDEQIDRVFAVMALCPQHTFQVLTKRPERMGRWFDEHYNVVSPGSREMVWSYLKYLPGYSSTDTKWIGVGANAFNVWPLPNVWLGVSVENQQAADQRLPLLLETPAAVKFISAEPLLEEISIQLLLSCYRWVLRKAPEPFQPQNDDYDKAINWVIVGGESGPGARPFNIEWARSLVRQCADAGVPCFVKQLGAKPHDSLVRSLSYPEGAKYDLGSKQDPKDRLYLPRFSDRKGGEMSEWPEDLRVRQMPEVGR